MKSSDERRRAWPLITGIVLSVLALTALPALAALTFGGTTISGDSGVTVDSSSTISIGATSATGITIGRPGITASFPGTVTITGTTTTLQNLVVSGSCSGCGIGNFTAGGDLSGSSTLQTVIGLQGRAISSTAPSANQVLTWNGSFWTPANVSSTGGSASGTVNSGNTGQIAAYNSTGTAVSGSNNFLVGQGGSANLVLFGSSTPDLFPQTGGASGTTEIDHTFRTAAMNTNVATFQSLATNGFSAIRFADQNGNEHAAIGYGNSGVGAPFTSATYIESSDPGATLSNVPPLKIVTTAIAGSRYVRMVFDNDGGNKMYATNDGLRHFTFDANGDLLVAGCNLDATSTCTGITGAPVGEAPLDVFGPAVFSMPPVANNSRGTVAAGNFPLNAIEPANATSGVLRLVRDTVVKIDFDINGTGSTRQLDLTDTDNGSDVPLTIMLNGSGDVGIDTTAPSTTLQVAGTNSTIRIGAASLPGCLEMGNSDGSAGINYITVLNGVMIATTTKPTNCQ